MWVELLEKGKKKKKKKGGEVLRTESIPVNLYCLPVLCCIKYLFFLHYFGGDMAIPENVYRKT